MSTSETLVNSEMLKKWTASVFEAVGCPASVARDGAEVLHYADINGIDSHGVANLERIYVSKIRKKLIIAGATPLVVKDFGAVSVFDARGGLGLHAGRVGMTRAVEMAAAFGVGFVAVRNSSHFGAAGFYSTEAIHHGMVGFAATNLGSQSVAPPPNGTVAMLGTNPISAAVPSSNMPSFVLDMSTTATATGKIRLAAQQGRPIPKGWLIDGEGKPVVDPNLFEQGRAFLQFAGGHKGYGLAVLVDILCGLLSGASTGTDGVSSSKSAVDTDVGHVFMALNACKIQPNKFEDRVSDMLKSLVECPVSVHSERRSSYAGLEESRLRTKRLEEGIPMQHSLLNSLERLACDVGVAPLDTRGSEMI